MPFQDALIQRLLDLPFNLANTSQEIQRRIRPNIPFGTRVPPEQQTAGQSAQLRPLRLPPESDIDTSQLISQMGLRPAAEKFLSQIPVQVGGKRIEGYPYPGVAHSEPRMIGIKPGFVNKDLLLHELLHLTPRLPFTGPDSAIMKKIVSDLLNEKLRSGRTMTKEPDQKEREEMFARQELPEFLFRHIFNQ